MWEILKATAGEWDNSFLFREFLYVTLASSNSKVYNAITLKFSAKQISLICNVCNL